MRSSKGKQFEGEMKKSAGEPIIPPPKPKDRIKPKEVSVRDVKLKPGEKRQKYPWIKEDKYR